MTTSLSEELNWRGFVNQTTLKDINELDKGSTTFYWGVDPSAPSMTIGNLAAAMMVRHFITHGHRAFLLIGGATGLIGDPDGKTEERTLKPKEEVEANKDAIVGQYKQIFGGQDFKIVDNYDWFRDIKYLDFLRDVGKHVPMRQMLARDFIGTRLAEDGSGISYAEFSYSLIQGYDFLHLFRDHNVTMQVAGSDQWGNSIAGVELIRRVLGKTAHVWTAPLIINKSTGQKFGKTEAGAIWLDPELTSPYTFYQFWLNVDDEGVEGYLKIYTLLSKDEIDKVMSEFNSNKKTRLAQKVLADEVTKLVHGIQVLDSVRESTRAVFDSKQYDFEHLQQELRVVEVKGKRKILDILVDASLANSKSEARRFLEQGGVYLNDQKVEADKIFSKQDTLDGVHAVLRRGKNSTAILKMSQYLLSL